MGLIKPTQGRIEFNGVDITDINNEKTLINYRKMISHVPQSIFVNDVTILENIAFGEKILNKFWESCKVALPFYMICKKFRKGLYSIVGEEELKLLVGNFNG